MPFKQFDRSELIIKPLSERQSDITRDILLFPEDPLPEFEHSDIAKLAAAIRKAKDMGASVIMMMGAHVIRSGVGPLLIDLMKKKYITHFALNGAGAIHDFELALAGVTTESVARYISEGQFGLWEEPAYINEAVSAGAKDGLGMGEAIGKWVNEHRFPYAETSLFAAAYTHKVPVTVHVGIGCDIVHEHENCDGASLGQASYADFLIFTESVSNLENGVFLNFGSAVTGPEVYLKALSMARNVARQKGRKIANFTTAVFDLHDIDPASIHSEPDKTNTLYYYRPWKTIMARTVADGGHSCYIQGRHRETVSALYKALA